MKRRPAKRPFDWRNFALLVVFVSAALALSARAFELHVLDNSFLVSEGQARHLRTVEVSAHRGMILDRHGEPLAASAPVDSLWAEPGELASEARLPALAQALGMPLERLERSLRAREGASFMYLRRHMNPDDAEAVIARGFKGVHSMREYRRYYPAGEVTAHLVGFTDIDDRGQEGLEMMFDDWLQGRPGRKQVLRDRMGRVIADVRSIEPPRPGRDLVLSIDRRVQYLAYRELKSAVERHGARGGSLVMLDSRTGEVLAMVNQPSYNPNNRREMVAERTRNRSVTDVLEPGSAFKPFVLAAALESGQYEPGTLVDTSPGLLRVRGGTVRDNRDNGVIDLGTVLSRSSNVGASKIALSMDPGEIWSMLAGFGFGQVTDSGFPGEQPGILNHHQYWGEIGQATLSFGYGVAVTPLQLAQAYAVIAAGGERRPVSLLRRDEPAATPGVQVLDQGTAGHLLGMMERVVGPAGTATGALVRGYRIAGKTGTARKSVAGGYADDRYTAVFAGMAPASDPRLVMVVVVDEPARGEYYGGRVAAPVFGQVMAGALRMLDIPPDDLPRTHTFHAAGVAP